MHAYKVGLVAEIMNHKGIGVVHKIHHPKPSFDFPDISDQPEMLSKSYNTILKNFNQWNFLLSD